MSEKQTKRTAMEANLPVTQAAGEAFSEETTIDLLELMYQMLSQWKLLVSAALIGAFLAGIWAVLLATPKYEATSTIYVLSRKDSAINMSDLQIGAALTSDYIEVFDMWEVHEEVISNLDLPYTYDQMRGKLRVSNPSNTRILNISFTSTSPGESAQVANEYAKVVSQYIADTMATDKPNIMSVALTPTRPVSPHKARSVALGFILGGLLAAAYVAIRFIMDDKFKTADEIRKYTGLTTLAIVPVEDEDDRRGRRALRNSRREA